MTDSIEFDEGHAEGFGDVVILPPTGGELAAEMSEEDAQHITETIRNAAEMLWMLLYRAHQGKAWQALGYDTWETYVRAEFDMSRSRSYQILDQARVIREIEGVMPEGASVALTPSAARDLKGVLDEVLPEIAERTEGLDPSEAETVLDEIVGEQRDRLREERLAAQGDDDFEEYDGPYDGPYTGSSRSDDDVIYDDVENIDVVRIRRNVNAAHDLYSSLSALASLPDDLDEVIAIIPDERHAQIDANLAKAMASLERFAELWGGDDPEA